ncbi:hypothetical protein BJ741DRAFT_587861, partial [Chytriomyces cf. hyalinus JEL632]
MRSRRFRSKAAEAAALRLPAICAPSKSSLSFMSHPEGGNLVTVWILLALITIMAAVVLLNLYVILYEELKRRGKPWTLENIFSRINIFQIALSLSCLCYLCTSRKQFFDAGETDSIVLPILSVTFLGLCESFYVLFSWTRSSELIKAHISSRFATALKIAVHVAPLTYLSPGVCLLLQWQKAHNIILMVNGVLTLALDSVFATRFARQMLEMRNFNIPVPHEFKIISFYGLLSCLFCLFCVASFAMTLFTNTAPERHSMPLNAPPLYHAAFCLLFMFLVLITLTALVMKWRLGRPSLFARGSVHSLAREFLSEKDTAQVSMNSVSIRCNS